MLCEQLFQPVRWVEVIRRLCREGVDAVVECGPGRVLAGLCKRIEPGLKTFVTDTPKAPGERARGDAMNQDAAQTALVTGASRGIGQAVALELGRRGYSVVGTATSGAGVDAIRASFQAHGLHARAYVVDIAERAGVEALMADLAQAGSLPVVLVNNAGATFDNLLLRMTEDEWQRCIDVNLGGVYRLTKACLRAMMKARFGRIINVTSVVGATGNPGQCNYAAAKAGTIGFTRALAREVASRGITVNAVAPGFIDTDMTRGLTDEWRAELLRNIPLGRLGTAAEVAAAVAFLASRDAAYITGHTLHLNGGMYMS